MFSWKIVTIILEVRFEGAYRLWDRAGEATCFILSEYPEFEVKSGTPAEIVLVSPKNAVTFTLGLRSLNLQARMLTCTDAFLFRTVDLLFPKLLQILEVPTLKRLGNLFSFHSDTSTDESSRATIANTAPAVELQEAFASSDSKTVGRCISFNGRFELSGSSILVDVHPVKLEFSMDPMAPKPVVARNETRYAVEATFDAYNDAILKPASLSPSDLIRSNRKMLETRILPCLGQ
jgi:hypothetical protein